MAGARDRDFNSVLGAALGGDRAAFDQLVERSRQRLTVFVRSRVRPELRQRLDIDAVVSETFASAFESLARFDLGRVDGVGAEERWRAWLAGIARNIVLRALDALGRVRALELDPQASGLTGTDTSPSRVIRREERFDRLEEALKALSEDHRRVIRLSRIEGHSVREIAVRIGRSEEATKKLIWRGLKALRQRFGDTESLRLPARRLESRASGGTDGS